jgi:uncharacterized protein
MRITIRVRPGAARPGIGGEQAGALVVRVSARPVDGQATQAALAAVAAAFGVRRDAVTLVTGASSRTKIIDVAGGDPRVLADLLAGAGPADGGTQEGADRGLPASGVARLRGHSGRPGGRADRPAVRGRVDQLQADHDQAS